MLTLLSVRWVNITTPKKISWKVNLFVCLLHALIAYYSFSLPQALPWSQKFLHTVDKPASVLKRTTKKENKNRKKYATLVFTFECKKLMIYRSSDLTSLTCLTKSLLELDLPEWTYKNNGMEINWTSHCSDKELLRLLFPLHLSAKSNWMELQLVGTPH